MNEFSRAESIELETVTACERAVGGSRIDAGSLDLLLCPHAFRNNRGLHSGNCAKQVL